MVPSRAQTEESAPIPKLGEGGGARCMMTTAGHVGKRIEEAVSVLLCFEISACHASADTGRSTDSELLPR